MLGDVEKMVAIGILWGTTNAFIRRGVLLFDQHRQSSNSKSQISSLIDRVLFWQYSLPLILNLSASAAFFSLLRHVPLSLAVPLTNASSFAATAVSGTLLGEPSKLSFTLFGTFLIIAGIVLCTN